MFWLSYECFSILFNAFLLQSAISSHNSCGPLSINKPTHVCLPYSCSYGLEQETERNNINHRNNVSPRIRIFSIQLQPKASGS